MDIQIQTQYHQAIRNALNTLEGHDLSQALAEINKRHQEALAALPKRREGDK